jgi:hypothetical protein
MFLNTTNNSSSASTISATSLANLPDCAFALRNGQIFWTIASVWQSACDDGAMQAVFGRAPIAHQSCVLKRALKANATQYTLRNLPVYAVDDVDTSFPVMSLVFELLISGGKLQVAVDDALFEHLMQVTMQLQLSGITMALFRGAMARRDRAQFAIGLAMLSRSKAHESMLHATLESSRLLQRKRKQAPTTAAAASQSVIGQLHIDAPNGFANAIANVIISN